MKGMEGSGFSKKILPDNDRAGETIDSIIEKKLVVGLSPEQNVALLAHRYAEFDKELTKVEGQIQVLEDGLELLDGKKEDLESKTKDVGTLEVGESAAEDELISNELSYRELYIKLENAKTKYTELEKECAELRAAAEEILPNSGDFFMKTVISIQDQELHPKKVNLN